MITFTQQQKIQAFRNASEAKKDAAFSSVIADKIAEVAMNHRLDTKATQEFKHLIGAFIVDLLSVDTLLQNIDDQSLKGDVTREIIPLVNRVISEYKPEPEETEGEEDGDGAEMEGNENLSSTQNRTMQPQTNPASNDLSDNTSEFAVDRDELLRQIENPVDRAPKTGNIPTNLPTEAKNTPQSTPALVTPSTATPTPRNFIEQRLNSVVSAPKEEKKVSVESPKPQTRSYGGQDPYREPLE